jgi:hypothetical protein
VGEVGGALGTVGGADDPQAGPGSRLADLGEGVQEGHQVLGGSDAADPHEGVRVGGALLGLPHLGEGGRVHARVDGAELGAVGSAPFLPAAGVPVAGGDDGGPPVGLGGEPAVEGGQQRAYGGGGAGRGQVVRAEPHAVLGDQQGDAEEVPGEQAGQRRRAARGRVAQVDRAEAGVVVPVEGEGAQGAFEVRGDGEQVGDARLASRALGAGGATGALQGAYGCLGAERADQAALVAGEFGEPVEGVGETVRLYGRRVPRDPGWARRAGRRGSAEDGGQVAVALGEAPACAPAVPDPVLLGRPQRRGAHPADLRRQRDPALVLLALTAAERVDVELVPVEPAHEPVAPESGVTAHIRIATHGNQSDAHACTPDLPYGKPPLVRRLAAGRT